MRRYACVAGVKEKALKQMSGSEASRSQDLDVIRWGPCLSKGRFGPRSQDLFVFGALHTSGSGDCRDSSSGGGAGSLLFDVCVYFWKTNEFDG